LKTSNHNTGYPNVSLRQLSYFVNVAETGQIQTAANRVNISPSAVTDAIKALEQTLQTPLVERHHKGMNLTAQGQIFYQHARSILNQLDESVASFRHQSRDQKDKLRLGATVAVMGYFLAGPLSRFNSVFPNIEIEFVEQSREQLEQSLINQDVDIGVMITSNIQHTEKLNSITLFESRRSVWCATNHPMTKLDEVSIYEIGQQPFIQLDMDESRRNTDEICELFRIQLNRSMETASVEAVRTMVANGRGVTVLSDLLFRPWTLDGGRLQSLSIKEMIPSMNIGVAFLKQQKPRAAVELWLDFLKPDYLSA
jgi:molybdate transport repressor ModE-like protein